MDIQGCTLLLTGSNRGIGHAIASRLAREPVRLLAGVRDLDRYRPPEPHGRLRVLGDERVQQARRGVRAAVVDEEQLAPARLTRF